MLGCMCQELSAVLKGLYHFLDLATVYACSRCGTIWQLGVVRYVSRSVLFKEIISHFDEYTAATHLGFN